MLFLTVIYLIPILLFIDIYYLVKNRTFSVYRKLFFLLVSVYMLMLVDAVFLPFPINKDALDYVQRWGFGFDPKSMNFIPFSSSMSFKQAFLNLILLFPLGFTLPLIKRDLPSLKSVQILILTPLLIEIIQGFGSVLLDGYWKSLDINDFLLNACGALFGLFFIRVIMKKYSTQFDKKYWIIRPFANKVKST